MELYQISQFVAVVDTGSFTRGASRVAVSQSALSATIAKLEDELGVALLERKRNAVTPTAAGKRLYQVGSSLLQTCNILKADIRAIGAPRVLRVGIVRTLPTPQLGALLKAFRQAHPEVMVELTDAPASDLAGHLKRKELDVCLTTIREGDEMERSLALFDEAYVVIVSKAHRFAGLSSVTLADLQNEPFIVRTSCETFEVAAKALRSHDLKSRVVYRTDQDDRALGLVAAGIGITLMPANFCNGEVVAVPVADFPHRRTIGARWIADSRDPAIDLFISFAKSHRWMGPY
ncbi:LysR family transcriptional regulator [Paraburkholderia sp. UYCP14C]|uniref:LysR family transcriptional regulator n=1 Tax=Paraburkholderia sp. UYCP14C TaxID=2511130 RepID=UPI0010224B37|nr:LysR family transcriptional regulator [Paraburkholderia sp. UYCP14C]RZF26729.1 LysR family transcriptional regulator [Paraburkholderia sp. UYCP14C]